MAKRTVGSTGNPVAPVSPSQKGVATVSVQKRKKAALTPEDFVYSNNVAKLIESDNFGAWQKCRWIACQLENGEVIDGDDDIDALQTRLRERFGAEHYLSITVLGPRAVR